MDLNLLSQLQIPWANTGLGFKCELLLAHVFVLKRQEVNFEIHDYCYDQSQASLIML